jgi:hypothetical protein
MILLLAKSGGRPCDIPLASSSIHLFVRYCASDYEIFGGAEEQNGAAGEQNGAAGE